MSDPVILLTIPGLRAKDLPAMPSLSALLAGGEQATLVTSFPCVTWPAQANLLTGKLANEHGVVANGFYWREKHKVEMWTASNEKIEQPQIWDTLHEGSQTKTSAAWFPMLSKGSGADYVCMPAPVHNPDGSESLWCYTKPKEYYGPLKDSLGHFPLQHFWGPLANIKSTAWIASSAVMAMKDHRPDFCYIYLPHLDYAAQKTGPDSPQALAAVSELDGVIGKLIEEARAAYGTDPLWLVASEYVITSVDHVSYPNRVLREAGLLTVKNEGEGELIDFANTPAWALVDHQFSHVFVRDRSPEIIAQVVQQFADAPGISEVLAGTERAKYGMDHERSGEVILISTPNSWQAYYYWLDDAVAPKFARNVDIHRKPGYDPVELHFDLATRSIPLDATLIKGSHGAPVTSPEQEGVLISSRTGVLPKKTLRDTEVRAVVLDQFQ